MPSRISYTDEKMDGYNLCQTCQHWEPNWKVKGKPPLPFICDVPNPQTDPDLLAYCPSWKEETP